MGVRRAASASPVAATHCHQDPGSSDRFIALQADCISIVFRSLDDQSRSTALTASHVGWGRHRLEHELDARVVLDPVAAR
jgi:hypothetical protein